MPSRTSYAIKNASVGIISKLLLLVLGFVSRTVFIFQLGNAYLGVNGLYTEILSVLSFSELGFGSAMLFAMYKPVAENNEELIVKLLTYFKKIYRIIALVVAGAGIILLPFIPMLVTGADWLTRSELQIYYLLFLSTSVIEYFVSYKFCYIEAMQKGYIQTTIDCVIQLCTHIIQIAILLVWKNFLVYLIVKTVVFAISRLCIIRYLNKKYPLLKIKSAEALDKSEKQSLFKNVKGLVVHKFAAVAVHSTDNIIISSLSDLGVVAVGLISNYNLLINSVRGFVTIVFQSFSSGFGNIVASGDVANYRKVFKTTNFLSFWVYGFCATAFYVLIPPFISLWIGNENLIDNASFSLIILLFYLQGQSNTYINARVAKGDFNMDKWWVFSQAIVNLIVSIIGVKLWGLVGVYIGTLASRMVVRIGTPYSTYKKLYNESCCAYFLTSVKYAASTLVAVILTSYLTHFFLQPSNVTIPRFIGAMGVVLVVPNVIFMALHFRSSEFADTTLRIKQIIKGFKKQS